MDVQQTHQLGEQFTAALHALDANQEGALEQIVAMFSPEARLTNASLKLANEERTGIEGIRSFWSNYRNTFREAQTEFAQVTSNEQAAGLFWTTRGSDAEGQPLEYDGVSLLVFDNEGKIVQFRGYYDTRELTRKVASE